MLPITIASTARAFHSAKFTCELSAGGGFAPPAYVVRKRPLRARSASMIGVTICGSACSAWKGTIPIGIWFAPAPVISTVNCARAEPATSRQRTATILEIRVMRGMTG